MPLQRRTTFLMLLALIFSGIATFAVSPVPALAGGPGVGWVKADNVGGGCVTISPGQQVCSSETTPGVSTLYEYVPSRDDVNRGEPPGPDHGGDRTSESRDYCQYPPGLAAGRWHWGGHWTLSINRNTGAESWSGPVRTSWAFEHRDSCQLTAVPPQQAAPTATPTIVPTPPGSPGNPGGGSSVGVPTPTRTGLDDPTPTAFIPTPPPPPPPPPCAIGQGVSVNDPWAVGKWPIWTPDASEMSTTAPGPMRLPSNRSFNFTMEGGLDNYKDWEQQDDGFLWNTAEISIYNNSNGRIVGVPFIARQTFDGDGNIRSGNLKPDYLRAWVGTTATLLSPYPTTWDLFGPNKSRPDVTVTAANDLAPGQYHAWLRTGNGNCRAREQLVYFQVGSPADLRIKKNAPSTAYIGGELIYRIDYSNAGRGEAQGVVIRDTLPADLTFISADPAPSARNGNTMAWNLGTIAAGDNGSIFVTAKINDNAPASVSNTATATTITVGACATTSNCTSTVTTTIAGPTLTIEKRGPDVTITDTSITYQLVYRNVSQADALAVVIKDSLPAGLTFMTASPAPTSANGNLLTWNIGTLEAGATGTILVTAKVTATNGSITNSVDITTATRGGCTNAGARCNSSKTSTVIAPPVASGSLKLWLNSDIDPARGVNLTDEASVATPIWPAGEVLNFAPHVTLQPIRNVPGVYRVTQRTAAWSLAAINGADVSTLGCKVRDEPSTADMQGSSGGGWMNNPSSGPGSLTGCLYKYINSPNADQMQRQGHVYWTPIDPRDLQLRSDWYSSRVPDLKNASLRVSALIVLDLVDDNPTSSSYGQVIYTTSSTSAATFPFSLLVPRSTK